jgi:hypothetical protein
MSIARHIALEMNWADLGRGSDVVKDGGAKTFGHQDSSASPPLVFDRLDNFGEEKHSLVHHIPPGSTP